MNPFHDLSENGFAGMHESILGNKNRKENERKKRSLSSNRSHSVFSIFARAQACYARPSLASPDDSDPRWSPRKSSRAKARLKSRCHQFHLGLPAVTNCRTSRLRLKP